ncbi:glycerophosphodiester phosphodiesterase family protein [Microbacterium sp.]|uniref:glycerophosphodiester phosphodiesterase n=1 Tax=Microbacterium sp. TaxID=51671 RepID=UPI002636A55B|nr:glycerophosphodiester phosphodiesterase family protein [Microbacterium sp.]
MSVHRRRLWATGIIGIALWTAVTTLSSSAPEALAQPVDSDRSATTTNALRPLLPNEALTLQPFLSLREPGEIGAIIGHRGDSQAAPENTMPAFASTAEAGAEYFEIDLRLSSDGVPVVIHDKTVDRTTDGEGLVAELTIDELRSLDAGSWFDDSFAGTAIPTLDEVLAHAAAGDAGVVIEYKGAWSATEVAGTVEMIQDAGLEGEVITQSFSKKTVANIAQVAPGLPVGWLTKTIDSSIVATAQKIGADAVNPNRVGPRGVDLAHRAGLGVFVWTHDDDPDWAALTSMGVDGIITNRPGALVEWMLRRA